jgi:hypothetical protein
MVSKVFDKKSRKTENRMKCETGNNIVRSWGDDSSRYTSFGNTSFEHIETRPDIFVNFTKIIKNNFL